MMPTGPSSASELTCRSNFCTRMMDIKRPRLHCLALQKSFTNTTAHLANFSMKPQALIIVSGLLALQASAAPPHPTKKPVHCPSVKHRVDSVYVIKTTHDNVAETATFYPSRVQDRALWTITKPTTVRQTETVYPCGYEWVRSPAVFLETLKIPKKAPWPTPGKNHVDFWKREEGQVEGIAPPEPSESQAPSISDEQSTPSTPDEWAAEAE